MTIDLMIFLLGAALAFSLLDDGSNAEEDGGESDAEGPPNPVEGQVIPLEEGIRNFQGKGGDDTFTGGASDGSAIEGLQGDDDITVSGRLFSVFGGTGNDTVDLSGVTTGAEVYGGDGEDTVSGSGQNDRLYAGGANSTLEVFYGDQGPYHDDGEADVLDGQEGNDTLFFGAGDTATGGTGSDTFNITNLNTIFDASAHALITDWEAGEAINFFGNVPTEDVNVADDFTIEESGEDAVVRWQGQTVLVVEGAAGEVTADDLSYAQVPDRGPFAGFYDMVEGSSIADDTFSEEVPEEEGSQPPDAIFRVRRRRHDHHGWLWRLCLCWRR